MYRNLFKTYIKKALLVLTATAFGLGLTPLPSDSHALVDSPEPYLFIDINPGSESSSPGGLTDVNGTLFFTADDGVHGLELWKSDGTPAGTVMVKDINPGGDSSSFYGLIDVNGTLFFSVDDGVHGGELWKSDGTAAGTVMVKDISPGSGHSLCIEYMWLAFRAIDVNGTLFFCASDGVHGYELWKSDGTAAGTVLVKDINPSGGSSPSGLTDVNGTLFFTANDGVHGDELWKSDGTPEGTMLVKDIYPGSNGSVAWAGPGVLFIAAVNGTFFFVANDGVHGSELWKSDGTPEGTVLFKDINQGGEGSEPYHLTDVNGTLFFIADNGVHGGELWKSDGTTAGTVMVKDIHPGGMYDMTYPRYLTDVNGTLFFNADDGVHGPELWKSDGTAAGTVMLKDIYPGSDIDPDVCPWILTDINGTLFFTAIDGTHGREPWRSDGTEVGTVLVKDINPGTAYSDSDEFTKLNGMLFFRANDGVHGIHGELWALDLQEEPNIPPSISGTEAGQTVDDNGTIDPFSTVTISDQDTANITVTVSLDDPAKGDLVNLGGFVEGPPGTYTFTGSPAEATTAIRSLTFDPTEDRVSVGQAETTTFTISADDSIAEAVTDDTTTVIVTVVDKTKKIFLPLILR